MNQTVDKSKQLHTLLRTRAQIRGMVAALKEANIKLDNAIRDRYTALTNEVCELPDDEDDLIGGAPVQSIEPFISFAQGDSRVLEKLQRLHCQELDHAREHETDEYVMLIKNQVDCTAAMLAILKG